MNDITRICHDTYFSQRMNAINNAKKRLNQAADESLEILTNTNITSSIIDPIIDDINSIVNQFDELFSNLRRDFKLKKQASQYWIMLQPIMCDNDLIRYLEFMQMCYRQEITTLIKLVNQVELHIEQFDNYVDQMVLLHQINEVKYRKFNKIAFYVSLFVVIILAIWAKI